MVTPYKEKDVKITLNITKKVYDWLDMHPEINRSELFRKTVEQMMSDNHIHRMNPLFFIACSMSTCMAIVLIAISLTHYCSYELRLILDVVGCILIIITTITFFREKYRIKKENEKVKHENKTGS